MDISQDQPLVRLGPKDVDSTASRAAALRAARESLVLVRNEGGLLPVGRGTKLAFVGPHANRHLVIHSF